MTPELETALADLDLRAMLDPRLEIYSVRPGEASLRGLPAGWMVSEDLAHIAEHGGWWPGYFFDPVLDGMVLDWFDASGNSAAQGREHTIQWASFASVHDRDHCFAPALLRFTAMNVLACDEVIVRKSCVPVRVLQLCMQ